MLFTPLLSPVNVVADRFIQLFPSLQNPGPRWKPFTRWVVLPFKHLPEMSLFHRWFRNKMNRIVKRLHSNRCFFCLQTKRCSILPLIHPSALLFTHKRRQRCCARHWPAWCEQYRVYCKVTHTVTYWVYLYKPLMLTSCKQPYNESHQMKVSISWHAGIFLSQPNVKRTN